MSTREALPGSVPKYAPYLALGFLVVAILRCAWMSDDAYVTLRTVDNWVSGHGPIWNPGERVQAYTHPLWMLVLTVAYVFTREAFITSMLVGVAVSALAASVVVFRLGRGGGHGVIAAVALVMSRTFVDYSTSGLENPLSHLLVALLYAAYLHETNLERQRLRVFLCSALLMMTRLDLALIAGPPLLDTLRRTPWRDAVRPLALGLAPLLAWEAFSLVYYGSFVPNTALAKLDNGISAGRLWLQGGLYGLYQMGHDPLSLALIGAVATLGFATFRKQPRYAVLAFGVLAYVLYVGKIGGDFMAGRFFSVPTFASVCVLVAFLSDRKHTIAAPEAAAARERLDVAWGCSFALAIGALAPTPGPALGTLTAVISPTGIVDERQFWGLGHHLIGTQAEGVAPFHGVSYDGLNIRNGTEKVVVRQAVGAFGYHAGPDVYIVDRYALADPFLARLPVAKIPGHARPGHNPRIAPPGYIESLRSGKYRLVDPALDELWTKVRLVHSGPIFSAERWAAIWALNTGAADDLIDREFYADPYFGTVPLWALADPKHDGYGWDQPGVVLVEPQKGLEVTLEEKSHATAIDIVADHNDRYVLRFYRGKKKLGKVQVPAVMGPGRHFLQKRRVSVPAKATAHGFDTLVFAPVNKKDRGHSIGTVTLVDERAEP